MCSVLAAQLVAPSYSLTSVLYLLTPVLRLIQRVTYLLTFSRTKYLLT